MFEEQSLDQSALKKLTEELSRTKKKGEEGKRFCRGKSVQVLELCICPCA